MLKEQLQQLQLVLEEQLTNTDSEQLATALTCYFKEDEREVVKEKVKLIASLIHTHTMRNLILSQISKAPPAVIAQEFSKRQTEKLGNDLQQFF